MREIELGLFAGKRIKYQTFVVNDIEIIKPLVKTHLFGVKSEYLYLKQTYPGYKVLKRRLRYLSITGEDIGYDITTIMTADNEIKDVYFDTSGFLPDYEKELFKKD